MQELLQTIETITEAREQRINALLDSEEARWTEESPPAGDKSSETPSDPDRTWLWPVALSAAVVLVALLYQTWLLAQQNDQLTIQNTLIQEQSSLMREQNHQLRMQVMLLQEQSADIRDRDRQLHAQGRVLREHGELLQQQTAQLDRHNRLLRGQKRQLSSLSRQVVIDTQRAAIGTLSEVMPCSPSEAIAAAIETPAYCPRASTRARQEALHAYLGAVQPSGRSASPGRLDLSNTRLEDLTLSNTNLRDTDLRGAYMRGADLQGADVRGADLSASVGLERPLRWCFDQRTAFPDGFDPGVSDPDSCPKLVKQPRAQQARTYIQREPRGKRAPTP